MNREKYGFDRLDLPLDFYGHSLVSLENTGHITIDGRLSFHLTLYCTRCGEEHTVRGRLPPEQSSERKMAYIKLAVLGRFIDGCSNNSSNRKTY